MLQSGTLRVLFKALREAGYDWQPQTPDRLLSLRKDPTALRPLTRWLGLGLPTGEDELVEDGLPEPLLGMLHAEGFAIGVDYPATHDDVFKSEMAVSGNGDIFIVHDHWPPDLAREGGYVHYAAESAWLARACQRDLEGFIGKRVLDLGCSSGALAFEVAVVADEVLGLDLASRAIEWARVTAGAMGIKSARFETAAIGEKTADQLVAAKKWDTVVMNPPMVVPAKDAAYPHRDGGKLGIELPFVFLDFAHRHLRDGGEVLTLATNPIVNGKPAFFDKLDKNQWEFIEKRCLHTHFNQAVARKQGYADQGIQNIELWFLHLKKT